jgi:superfamily II DNA or RNA helicase
MATGTGKTITAIAAIFQLAEENREARRSTIAVVVCPYVNLVEQWESEFRRFGKVALPAYRGERYWKKKMSAVMRSLSLFPGRFEIILVTQATFITDSFQQSLREATAELVLVGDEVHNFGAQRTLSKLPAYASARLGVSATPERWLDEEGTKAIHEYFGNTSFELGIKEAISKGILCEYRYVPVICPLSTSETEEYGVLTKRLITLLKGREFHELVGEEAEKARMILRARSSITGNAASKLPELIRQMGIWGITTNFLVYCAEGLSKNYVQGKQTDAVVDALREVGLSSRKYDSETELVVRKKILKDFGQKKLDGIVSMRCLDEGVDVPNAASAIFMASSNNPRQFVQRRGRVLRKAPGKSEALLVDLFVVPNLSPDSEWWDFEKKIVEREIRRADEFADSAINAASATILLNEVRKNYGLR